jgi:fatty acid desaturase
MNSNERAAAPAGMPVPNWLNLFLVMVVAGCALTFLWLASRLEHPLALGAAALMFSYVLLTNYALLHEATHNNLHSSRNGNYCLGVLTGALFPIPFSMIRITHQGHHLRNRTDFEMFDLYYERDIKVIKFAQWYSILCGLFYPIIPLGAVVFVCWPGLVNLPIFQRARSSRHLLGDIGRGAIWRIRLELLVIVGFFVLLFWLLELRWERVLLCYACLSFNWSTRQYIGHAFSKRDVVEGAWNLRHNRLMTWVLLHGEYDLNHHRHPEISWYYLPQLSSSKEPRPSYILQYLRQWLGPRPALEPAPESKEELPLTVQS